MQPGDVLTDRMPVDEADENQDDGEESDTEEVQKTITYDEIRESLRQRREEEVCLIPGPCRDSAINRWYRLKKSK